MTHDILFHTHWKSGFKEYTHYSFSYSRR